MQQQYKQRFQRMNLDVDVRGLQPGEYRKLYNGITVSPASSSYTNAIHEVLSSLFGNAVVSYSLPSGTNKCIGFLEDKINDRAFYFVYNSTAANNSIYRFQSGSITLVFRSSVLDFASTDVIDADIIGDILIFTNRRTETYKLDIGLAIAGSVYATPALEEVTLLKPQPTLPLTPTPAFDALVTSSRLAGNYFQFYYRYIYENNDYSVFSPSSEVTNSWGSPAIIFAKYVTNQNVTLSGTSAVDGITLSAGEKILVVAQTNPVENGVYTAAAGAWSRVDLTAGVVPTNTFIHVWSGLTRYNTTWQFIDTAAVETIGSSALYFRQIPGPNYITVARNATIPDTVTKIEYAVRVNGSNELYVYRQEVPAFSVSHSFYNDSYLFTVPDSESFKWNDSVPLVTNSLKVFKNKLFLYNNTEGYTHSDDTPVGVTLTTYAGTTETKTYTARKAGGSYNVGIIYKGYGGRHSGVQNIQSISIPDSNTTRYNLQIDTSGLSEPAWATHFSIAVTRCTNVGFFLKDTTTDIYHYTLDANGDKVYTKTSGGQGAVGTAIDISCLTKNRRGYTFSSGDRVKIYYVVTSGEPNTIIDVQIIGQEGNFILTRLLSELELGSACTNLVFEIYTPKTQSADPFFEVGEQHPIASLAAGSFLLNGDVEILRRIIYTDSSTYSTSDPFANTYVATSITSLEAMNAWDESFTSWIDQGGRSLIKTDSLQILKTGWIRFSNPYIQNSSVFGINVFDALNEYALPIENGNGVQLADTGDVLVAIHETETTSVYVGEGFVSTRSGTDFLAKTESVIGDDRRYQGGYGTVHPASVVVRNGRVYFFDIRRGAVVRRSQDGLTVISEYGVRHEMSTLAIAHQALGANSRIIGGWDPQYECYTLSFIDTTGPTGYTYYFHEKSNFWVCLTDLRPEFFGILGQKQLAFSGGALWQQSIETNYNNWFGVQYNRRLEFEISPMQSLVHLWDAIEIDVASIYVTAGTNEDVVLLYHTNGGTLQTRINYADFQLKEGVYRSSFFRDLNDINFQNTTESKYKSPNQIRGQSAFLVVTYNGTDKNVMKSITVFYTPSMNSSP